MQMTDKYNEDLLEDQRVDMQRGWIEVKRLATPSQPSTSEWASIEITLMAPEGAYMLSTTVHGLLGEKKRAVREVVAHMQKFQMECDSVAAAEEVASCK